MEGHFLWVGAWCKCIPNNKIHPKTKLHQKKSPKNHPPPPPPGQTQSTPNPQVGAQMNEEIVNVVIEGEETLIPRTQHDLDIGNTYSLKIITI